MEKIPDKAFSSGGLGKCIGINPENGNAKIVVGYDLGNTFSQISYYNINSPEPETVSSVIGTQMYNIPTILAKRPGVGQWYGKRRN